MTLARLATLLLLGSLLWSGCTFASSPGTQGAGQAPAAPSRSTLEIAIYAEPSALTEKPLSSGSGTNFYTTLRMFNADLAIVDQQGKPQPYLAAALPQLGSDSWRVAADGEMDTTFKLKPNLTWHDGAPLTADDFVFAWQVYTTAAVGIANGSPQNRMADAAAPDAETLQLHWKQPYFNAGTLAANDFPPLPRHVLGAPFEDDPSSLATNPFWTRDYVGAGPFRITQWEPGAFIAAEAFPGHSLSCRTRASPEERTACMPARPRVRSFSKSRRSRRRIGRRRWTS